MIFRLNGKILEGQNYSDIMLQMKERDFELPETVLEYKQNVVRRANLKDQSLVLLKDKKFIQKLEKADLISELYRFYFYGSLRYKQGNHYLVSCYEHYREKDCTVPQYQKVLLNGTCFFGAVPNVNDSIECESYLISKHALDALDSLEGHPTVYKRFLVPNNVGKLGFLYVYAGLLR